MPSSGETYTTPFIATDTIFVPNEFTGIITNNWTTVPYCENDFAAYGDPATDHLAAIHDPVAGIGDICRYMGDVDGATWRMPTAKDWEDLYGSAAENGGQSVKLGKGWVEGDYYPLSGLAMGAGQNDVSITYGAADTDAQVNNVNPWINGAVFLPASGWRSNGGLIYCIGTNGMYWSSTANNIVGGYYMQFTPSRVLPQNTFNDSRNLAMSIRCIRE